MYILVYFKVFIRIILIFTYVYWFFSIVLEVRLEIFCFNGVLFGEIFLNLGCS